MLVRVVHVDMPSADTAHSSGARQHADYTSTVQWPSTVYTTTAISSCPSYPAACLYGVGDAQKCACSGNAQYSLDYANAQYRPTAHYGTSRTCNSVQCSLPNTHAVILTSNGGMGDVLARR